MAYGLLHRGSQNALSARIRMPGRPRRVFVAAEIESGWLVVDPDGLSVGKVASFEGDFLTVSRGFGRSRLYVPPSGIGEITEGTVKLNLTNEAIDASRWSERPRRQS